MEEHPYLFKRNKLVCFGFRTFATILFWVEINLIDRAVEKQPHYLCGRLISFMSIRKLSFEDPIQRDSNRVLLSRTPDQNLNSALGYRLVPIPKLDRSCDEYSGRQINHVICYVSSVPVHQSMAGSMGGLRGPPHLFCLRNFVIFLKNSWF